MFIEPDFTDRPAFEVRLPARQDHAFVFNTPHSGRHYPDRFLKMSRLDSLSVRRSEDLFVDELFGDCIAHGAPMLVAHFPRAYLDVNREPYELDQRMFADRLPAFANRQSIRVAGGLGTIPRVVAEGQNIYGARLSFAEARTRIEGIYKPYHSTLRGLLAATHRRFGHAVLVDCHSMPASIRLGNDGLSPDFVIGDRFGTSASGQITQAAIDILRAMGYFVVANKPYAGGFITEHYGRPAMGLHAIQVEVNRGLYVNESTLVRKAGFESLQGDLGRFCERLMRATADISDYAIAAE